MIMRRQVTAVITATAIGICALNGISGCADNQWRYQPSWTVDFGRLTQNMIETCQLTASDTLMVDLSSRQFIDAAAGRTCGGIRQLLATYREHYGEQPMALRDNPASADNPPSLDGLLYAMIITRGSPWPGARLNAPSEVLVKFATNQVTFNRMSNLLLPNEGTTVPLDATNRAEFLDALTPVLTWGNPWLEVGTNTLEMSSWQITVVTADARLYRWFGYRQPQSNPTATTTMVPPGLVDVYKAFWALANP